MLFINAYFILEYTVYLFVDALSGGQHMLYFC